MNTKKSQKDSKVSSTEQNLNLNHVYECNYCPADNHEKLKKKSELIIYQKYFEAFNFYFAKPINEILANIATPHVIFYKDYLYYDDIREYFKRTYTIDESLPRIKNLNDFYIKAGNNPRPNLSIHEQNKFIQKRNMKIHKLFLAKLQNYADMPKTTRDRDQDKNPNPIEFRILASNINDEESNKNINPLHKYDHDGNSNNNLIGYSHNCGVGDSNGGIYEGSFKQLLEKFEKNMMKISFESKEHNIYNPSFSSERSSFDYKPTPMKNIIIDNVKEIFTDHNGNPDIAKGNTHLDTSISISNEVNQSELINKVFSESYQNDPSDIMLIHDIINTETTTTNNNINNFITHTRFNSATTPIPPLLIPKNHQLTKLGSGGKITGNMNIKIMDTPEGMQRIMIKGQEYEKVSGKKEQIGNNGEGNNVETTNYIFGGCNFGEEKVAKANLQNEKIALNPQADSSKKSMPSSKNNLESVTEPSTALLTNHSQSVGLYKSTPNSKNANKNGPPKSSGKCNTPRMFDNLGNSQQIKDTTQTKDINKIKDLQQQAKDLQNAKDFVQKQQKYPEDVLNSKLKISLDEFKKSLAFQDNMNSGEKSLETKNKVRIGVAVASNDQDKFKKTEKFNQLGRSKTEDGLFQKIGLDKLKKQPYSPLRVIEETGINQGSRNVVSPSNNRKNKHYYRVLSNEGIPMNITNTTSGFQIASTNSNESSKSIETPADNNKKSKSLKKSEGISSKQEKREIKPPLNININRPMNITPQPQTFQLTNQQILMNKSLPVSPNRKIDLKLNLNKMAESNNNNTTNTNGQRIHTEEIPENNSYGFWTSRSLKGTQEEQLRQKKSADFNKDYFIKNKYSLADNLLKEKKFLEGASRSSTKSNVNLGVKFKDGLMMATMSNLNKNLLGQSKNLGLGNQYFNEKKPTQGIIVEGTNITGNVTGAVTANNWNNTNNNKQFKKQMKKQLIRNYKA